MTMRADENDIIRQWDRLAYGDTSGLDPALVETVRRLRALDSMPAPDAAFKAALRQRLVGAGERQISPASAVAYTPDSAAAAISRELAQARASRPFLAWRSRHVAELLAVAAVLIMLVGAVALVARGGDSSAPAVGAASPSVAPTAGASAVASAPATPQATAPIAGPTIVHDSTPPSSTAYATASAVPTADGVLLSEDEAASSARAFLDAPGAVLTNEFIDQPAWQQRFRFYCDVPGAAYPDELEIDADTGEVVAGILHSHASHVLDTAPVAQAEARAIAATFASAKFADFDTLTLHDENSVSTAAAADGGDMLYSVIWQLRAPDSGAWLPTFVRVGVDLVTGAVYSYDAMRTTYDGPTVPVVTQQQAVDAALVEAHRDERMADIQVASVTLFAGVYPSALSEPDQRGLRTVLATTVHLVWQVQFANVPDDVKRRSFDVDAITGEVLNPWGAPNG
jgi:hypothetical protein